MSRVAVATLVAALPAGVLSVSWVDVDIRDDGRRARFAKASVVARAEVVRGRAAGATDVGRIWSC